MALHIGPPGYVGLRESGGFDPLFFWAPRPRRPSLSSRAASRSTGSSRRRCSPRSRMPSGASRGRSRRRRCRSPPGSGFASGAPI